MSCCKLTAFLITISLSVCNAATSIQYSMQDLKVLATEKNAEEFLNHALDIVPSQRNQEWNTLTTQMAVFYLEDRLQRKSYLKTDFLFVEKICQWPVLNKNELLIIKRNKYGTSFLQHCFESGREDCLKSLDNFWNNTPKQFSNAGLGVTLAELIQTYHPETDIWPYCKETVTGQVASIYCQKKAIKTALIKEAIKLIDQNDKDNLASQLLTLANKDCWQSLQQELQESLQGNSRSKQDYAFSILRPLELLSQRDRDLYLTRFILEGPSVGDTFNEAWNTIKELGQDYKRRSTLLSSLKKLDPLPGTIFGSSDPKKRSVIMDLLHKNIPEYLDYYAKTCLGYLEGKQSFPNGNPTLECRELFKIAKGTKWVETSLQQHYANLPTY